MRENLLCCCSLVALQFATKISQVVQKVVLTVFSSSHKTSVVSRDLISQKGLTSQDESFVLHCAKNILLRVLTYFIVIFWHVFNFQSD